MIPGLLHSKCISGGNCTKFCTSFKQVVDSTSDKCGWCLHEPHLSLVESTTRLKDVQNLVQLPPEMHLLCSNPGIIAASRLVMNYSCSADNKWILYARGENSFVHFGTA